MRVSVLRPALPALVALTVATSGVAQSDARSAGATLRGVVYDSLAGAPLAAATVQLAAAAGEREVIASARSGEDGSFAMAGVPPGRYRIGFLHPVLDSLGLDVPARELVVAGADEQRVDLAVPSARRVRTALCGGSAQTPPAVQVGVVRRALDLAPVEGAVVDAGWSEYTIGIGRLGGSVARLVDTTGADGRYRFCGVPRGGAVVLRVTGGGARTPLVDVDVPSSGIGRRDLYLGSARTVARLVDSAGLESTDVEIEVGEGRLGGRVLALDGGRPVADARVGIIGGREVRSGEDGAWTLRGIPTGTRLLEVRAVGHASKRLSVDVYPGAPSVEVRLATVGALLDTVRVTASRHRLHDTGFERRARSGAGRYVTTRDMLRRPVVVTSQVFHAMPGLRVERATFGSRITMRGAFGRCSPAVYVDGVHWRDVGTDDIDMLVSPDEVAGIEVYGATTVPPEFSPGMTGCGSIVIWRKLDENPARLWSRGRRALQGMAAILLGVGVGALLTRL